MGDLGVQRGARLRLAVQGQILPGEVILVLNGRGGESNFVIRINFAIFAKIYNN